MYPLIKAGRGDGETVEIGNSDPSSSEIEDQISTRDVVNRLRKGLGRDL